MVHLLWTFAHFLKALYQNIGLNGTNFKIQIKYPCLRLNVTFNVIFFSLLFLRNCIIFLLALGPACLHDTWLYTFQSPFDSTLEEKIMASKLLFFTPLSSVSSKFLSAQFCVSHQRELQDEWSHSWVSLTCLCLLISLSSHLATLLNF